MFSLSRRKRSNTVTGSTHEPKKTLTKQFSANTIIHNNQSVTFNTSKPQHQEGATEIFPGQLTDTQLAESTLREFPSHTIGSKHHKSLKNLFKSLSLFHKKKEYDPKVSEFVKLIDFHKDFFKKAPEIDKYVITLSFLYLKRAFPEEFLTNEVFFYALYLAWETEEDSTLGLESIIHYVIGSYPSSKNKDKNQRKQEILEWRMRLREFHTGKDILWKALDYKTVIDYPQILKATKTFPSHDILKRERTYSQSIKFF
eukprot:gene3619-4147_t